MKNKKILFGTILFMSVGLASVVTNVIIIMTTLINKKSEDFGIQFTSAKVNGVLNNDVITATDTISFKTDFSALGDTYTIDYEIYNPSQNYDAKVTVDCPESTNYLTITNSLSAESNLQARYYLDGKLVVQLSKSYVGDTNLQETITCKVNATAVERTSLGFNPDEDN